MGDKSNMYILLNFGMKCHIIITTTLKMPMPMIMIIIVLKEYFTIIVIYHFSLESLDFTPGISKRENKVVLIKDRLSGIMQNHWYNYLCSQALQNSRTG